MLHAYMATRSRFEFRIGQLLAVMYLAITIVTTSGIVGSHQSKLANSYNVVEAWTIGNQSLPQMQSTAPTASYSPGLTSILSPFNGSENCSLIAVPAVKVLKYYNESAAEAEWAHFYDLIFSWQGICLIAVFCTFIIVTIIGNTLIILAVMTTRRLRTVTNCFVMSLAIADLLVGMFVMPPAVAVHLIGSWQLGWVLCDIWISFDVLLCTASILSLCAISVDRYLAVTQPLTYSRKRRSKRLALLMILIVWILALAITCPPMLGWYEPGRRNLRECRYNQNEGYVIFSAMGSFFIPMAVMVYVYAKISCVVAKRHDNMTDIYVHQKKLKRYTAADVENECSEQEQSAGYKNKQLTTPAFPNKLITNNLHETVLNETSNLGSQSLGGNCQSLMALSTNYSAKVNHSCQEVMAPSSISLKRTCTASATMTTMATGLGPSKTLLDAHWQTQSQEERGSYNIRLSQLSASAGEKPRSQLHKDVGSGAPDVSNATSTNIKSLSNRITSLKKENKTTQTLSIVVGGFIACWLPFFVYYLITPFLSPHQVSGTLAKALTWLGWFNSAINPFIYAFYSVEFRAAFWRLTCKRFLNGEQKPQFPASTMSFRR